MTTFRNWDTLPLWLDVKIVAAILRISEVTLRKYARDGTVPAKKFGARLWRFNRDEIRQMVEGGGA
jgi:excisionase family DNA binding protein